MNLPISLFFIFCIQKLNSVKRLFSPSFIFIGKSNLMQQVKETLENKGYTIIDQIGQGFSAHCFKVASEKYCDHPFVVKIIPKKHTSGPDQEPLFKREIAVLSEIDSPNVVKLYEYFEDSLNFYLILEYCPTSLQLMLQCQSALDPRFIKQIFANIVHGLLVLHQNGIAHLDIKPHNILIDSYNRAKIIDFGFSEVVDSQKMYSRVCGTYAFMAPEMLKSFKYDPFKADIWSLGITFYFIIRTEFPKRIISYEDFWNFIYEDTATMEEYGPIIRMCMQMNPNDRPTIAELEKKMFPVPPKRAPISIPANPGSLITKRRSSFMNIKKIKMPIPQVRLLEKNPSSAAFNV